MQEIYNKFLKYDFQNDLNWKTYLNNIHPIPNYNQLAYLKKKYYKKEVDDNFDVNYVPSSYNTTSNQDTSNNKYNQSSYNNNNEHSSDNIQNQPRNNLKIYVVETIIHAYYILSCFNIFSNSNPLIFSVYALILRTIRLNWPVKFNKQYLISLMSQDCFGYLIYSLIMYMSCNKVYVYLIPSLITSCIYILGFHRRNVSYFPNLVTTYFNKFRKYQDYMISIRSYFEILILPISIVGILIGFNSFFLPIMYYQFIKMRINIDIKLKNVLNKIQKILISKQNETINVNLKWFYSKIITLTSYLNSN